MKNQHNDKDWENYQELLEEDSLEEVPYGDGGSGSLDLTSHTPLDDVRKKPKRFTFKRTWRKNGRNKTKSTKNL